MSTVTPPRPTGNVVDPRARARAARDRLNRSDLRGNAVLRWLSVIAGVIVIVVLLAVVVVIIVQAIPAISHYGFKLLGSTNWSVGANQFGTLSLIFGSLVTSLLALIGATILGVAIGLYLALIAPRWLARIIGPLVEMLAAVPSLIIGVIGIKAFAPAFVSTIDPALHSVLGWTTLFGPVPAAGESYFLAAVVLTFMVLPIIAALTRDAFLSVPSELIQGAEALGATRWEVIRGVVLPTCSSGILSACVLGFGRAIGEAIAVAQVIGGAFAVTSNLFQPGNTLASVIALEYSGGTPGEIGTHALFFCALLLLIIGVGTQLVARRIARNFTLAGPR